MKRLTLPATLALCLLNSALSPTSKGAEITLLQQNGNWSDPALWSGGVPPATPGGIATNSLKIEGLSGGGGTVLINQGAGDYRLQSLSYDDSVNVMFRNSTDITNNNVLMQVEGNLVKEGSGTLQFRNNTNGSIALHIGGDLTMDEGIIYVGVAAAGATNFSVSGKTTVNGGLLGLRLGRRGTEPAPTTLGEVTVATGAEIALSLGGNNSTTTEYFEFTRLNGGGAISVTNATAVAYTGELAVNTTGHDHFSGSLLQSHTGTGGAALRLAKRGTGTLTLSGASTFSGGTTVHGGTLIANHAQALGSGGAQVQAAGQLTVQATTTLANRVTLNGGTLLLNGTLSAPSAGVSFTALGGRVSGNGRIDAALALTDLNQILSPGESTGILHLSANQSWEALTYEWELDAWDDRPEEAGDAYDQIMIDGSLDLSNGNAFRLTLSTESGLADFSETSRSWVILEAQGGITGFNTTQWEIDPTLLSLSTQGSWSLSQQGDQLLLNYTAVPEPGTFALLALVAGGWFLLQRRRAMA